jgi:excisionase family DNA binding protein
MPTNNQRARTARPPATQDIYLTPMQVAQKLQVRPRTVQAWLRTGLLNGVKLPGSTRWRIAQSEVDKLDPSVLAEDAQPRPSRLRQHKPDVVERAEAGADAAPTAWLDADVSRLGEYEPYNWGPDGPPAADPIFWDAASGQFMVQEAG